MTVLILDHEGHTVVTSAWTANQRLATQHQTEFVDLRYLTGAWWADDNSPNQQTKLMMSINEFISRVTPGGPVDLRANQKTPPPELLTAQQVELARHALGLPNARRQSYRNFFVAGPGHRDYDDWTAMVRTGHAVIHNLLPPGAAQTFHLTPKGLNAALNPGESLGQVFDAP